jgi:hypothetical protein
MTRDVEHKVPNSLDDRARERMEYFHATDDALLGGTAKDYRLSVPSQLCGSGLLPSLSAYLFLNPHLRQTGWMNPRENRRPTHIRVTWEPATQPNSDALARAYAMIFRMRPLEPERFAPPCESRLTKSDEELKSQCKVVE